MSSFLFAALRALATAVMLAAGTLALKHGAPEAGARNDSLGIHLQL